MDRDTANALAGAFLSANANRETIANEMAMVMRDLMRAASSENDDGYKASQQMNRMMEYLSRCKEPLTWGQIFSDALQILRQNLPKREYEADYIDVAKSGIKYFVESSADDNAAAGRSASRLSDLKESIRWLQKPKDTSPERERSRKILAENAMKLAGKLK